MIADEQSSSFLIFLFFQPIRQKRKATVSPLELINQAHTSFHLIGVKDIVINIVPFIFDHHSSLQALVMRADKFYWVGVHDFSSN